MAGIYRGGCDRLSCIETLKCCKMIVGEKRYVCAFVLQSSDQYQYLSNCAPTPPLTCYNKLISSCYCWRVGGGLVRSCPDTRDNDPNFFQVPFPILTNLE